VAVVALALTLAMPPEAVAPVETAVVESLWWTNSLKPMDMKTLITLAAVLAASLTALAQRASESVVTANVTTVTRLVSVVPVYSEDSNVTLRALQENFVTFTRLADGSEVNKATFARQYTLAGITNLPTVWTNRLGTVVTNNPYKNALQTMWTRLDGHPELTVIVAANPGIVYIPPPPEPEPEPEPEPTPEPEPE
jgi:hypothetical protein